MAPLMKNCLRVGIVLLGAGPGLGLVVAPMPARAFDIKMGNSSIHLGTSGADVKAGNVHVSVGTSGASVSTDSKSSSSSTSADSDSDNDQQTALDAVRNNQALPLDAILKIARRYTDGQIIDARLMTVRGFLLYQIKVLDTAGNVGKLYFYARTGHIVK